ncbi:MAG: 6-phosphogluconolactonase [Verrucomicrobia subdivision 3 bacterium]|nr:6-phosphogluconolactonase [Limisphaerales bacterium]MCS1412638.1 6-phosphogluconolactonase [Limisphaerales bacterium]
MKEHIWHGKRCVISEFESADALAIAVAERWLEFVAGANRLLSVGLSGGRITERLFAQIASKALGAASVVEKLRFFWADERCVPLDDSASNYRLARELLFDPLGVLEQQTFPFGGDGSPSTLAEGGLRMLREQFDVADQQVPVFDLVLLGMGEDGHVASLFPGNFSVDQQRLEACYDVIVSKPPPNRITLSYGVLAAAREVWLVISGQGKAAPLSQAIQSTGGTPVAHLLSLRSSTKIFTDIALRG